MSASSIIILGGGIGGLTLGRCLKHKGIASIIYDRAPNKPRHTYGMTLESWAYRPLLKYLGLDEHTFRRKLAVDRLHENGIGQYSKTENGREDSVRFRANRYRLECLLREGLDVKAEHQLSDASLTDDSSNLEITFKDGQRLSCSQSLVVDAIGVHSPLRQSLLSKVSPTVLPFVAFNGKRYVSSDLFKKYYASELDGSNIQTSALPGGQRLEVAINDYKDDGQVSISYIYSRKARTDGQDRLHKPDRAQAEASEINEDFYEEVKRNLNHKGVATAFSDAFDVEKLREDRLLHWLMRTVLIPKEDLVKLSESNIVMLGDSCHATPILGGKGANSAICDAIELAEIISSSGLTGDGLTRFYENRWPVWKKEIEESDRRIEEMHSIQEARL